MTVYKKVRLMKDGTLRPLFIGKRQAVYDWKVAALRVHTN